MASNSDFYDWKSEGADGKPHPCEECRKCRGGLGRVSWAGFAGMLRFLNLIFGDPNTRAQMPDAGMQCPRCLHTAFWHEGQI